MANEMSLELRGLEALQRDLLRMSKKIIGQLGPALRAEAEIEMTEAKRRTPVLTGALRASGHVTGPEEGETSEITVRLGFGGPAAPYALMVHEDMEAFHRNGQAKFLESTLKESAKYLPERIARRLKLE